MGDIKSCWVTRSTSNEKEWGSETSWGGPTQIYAKVLNINAGYETSLKRYKRKNECFYIAEGEIIVLHGDEDFNKTNALTKEVLGAGHVFHAPANCPYQLRALKDSVVIEISDNRDGEPEKIISSKKEIVINDKE
tara:strand:+ start:5443 stop:5847 length:405 start_codon:yes stop_codon:yes gene_type:complete